MMESLFVLLTRIMDVDTDDDDNKKIVDKILLIHKFNY